MITMIRSSILQEVLTSIICNKWLIIIMVKLESTRIDTCKVFSHNRQQEVLTSTF